MKLSVMKQKANPKTKVTKNKAYQIFWKPNIFLHPDTHTYVCISGGKKCRFSRNLARFISPFLIFFSFYDSPFCYIADDFISCD